MSQERMKSLTPAEEQAVSELKDLVERRYPAAEFSVERGVDDPSAIHLLTTVDVENTDEVMDLVVDRVLELQIDQGLPVHVIPTRPLERSLEEARLGPKNAKRQLRRLAVELEPLAKTTNP